jgi:hypothetical protein
VRLEKISFYGFYFPADQGKGGPQPADQTMTHIEFSPNFGMNIDLPPEYEHSHEFLVDP